MVVPSKAAAASSGELKSYYQAKIEAAELTINQKTQNLRRLEAQRNALNARGACTRPPRHLSTYIPCVVRLLREELQLLHEPGSYVGEVVKVMRQEQGARQSPARRQIQYAPSSYADIHSCLLAPKSSTSTQSSTFRTFRRHYASRCAPTRTPFTRSFPTRSTRSFRS